MLKLSAYAPTFFSFTKITAYIFATVYLWAIPIYYLRGIGYDALLPYESALCVAFSIVFLFLTGKETFKLTGLMKK